jgi:hypothetical protein
METAAEKHLENAAATKVRADSNSDGVSGYRGLNHHGRNHEASYFRDSCYFHVTTLAYRSAEAASSLRKQNDFFNPVVASNSCVRVDFGILVKQLMPFLKGVEVDTTHREDCYGKSNTQSRNPGMLNHRDE